MQIITLMNNLTQFKDKILLKDFMIFTFYLQFLSYDAIISASYSVNKAVFRNSGTCRKGFC